MRERLLLLVLALLISAVAVGCRSKRGADANANGSGSGAAATPCKKSYARCKLPGGPLGVCMPTTCKPGQPRPCYRCTPQH